LQRIRTLCDHYGKSIVLSTHILPDVRAVCDQVIMLVGGRVRIIDTLENLSRPAEPTVHLSIYGESHALVRRLKEQRFSVSEDVDGSLRVSPVQPGQIAMLWKLAAETDTSVRRLAPALNSLDKIFFEAASRAEEAADARP